MTRFREILRLSKTAIISLMETHARQVEPMRQLSIGGAHAMIGLEWRRRHIIVKGHSEAADLSIAFEGREGVTLGSTFNLQLERPDRSSGATASLNKLEGAWHFPAPKGIKIAKALFMAAPSVVFTLIRSASDIVTFLRTKDAATAGRLRKSFGITPKEDRTCILRDDLFSITNRSMKPTSNATIVVPVFNAANDLAKLLPRLKKTPYPVIFIDDCSDDPNIAGLLNDFRQTMPQTKIISHPRNLGFVKAANAGLEHSQGHVILLNSDALPPKGDWASRLLEPILEDSSIASVTPFSNNAEILSIPHPSISSKLTSSLIEKIDETAVKMNSSFSQFELPTGIGFCMAMNKEFLETIGNFDCAFGHGYGEEVDWCQKARRAGGKNIGLASLFVGHKGGASFKEETSVHRKTATEIISRRYPNYETDVQNWVENAPTQAHVLALSMAWLAAVSQDAVPVYIGHSMGGGADTALCAEVEKALQTRHGVIILRVGGPSLWRIELKGRGFSILGDASSQEVVTQLLTPLNRLHLIYSCGVGGRHPTDASDLLAHLFDDRCRLDINIHDFFPISPSWNLLNSKGTFNGVPQLTTRDPAHCVPALGGRSKVSHKEWRSSWAKLFSLCERVTTYSHASAELISEAYPDVSARLCVVPHAIQNLPDKIADQGSTIGVLGSLNLAKGAEVIQRLSNSTSNTRRIVVLGEMDGAFSIKKPSVFHGRYEQDQITDLATKYKIGIWFIPSICPETFSFATHEALATGLPVYAFARGAQGEAVENAPNGYLITADPGDTQAIAMTLEQAFATEKVHSGRQAVTRTLT